MEDDEDDDDDDDAEEMQASSAAWEMLIGAKRKRQACTCGLIPCLCADDVATSDWVAATATLPVTPSNAGEEEEEEEEEIRVALNPDETRADEQRHLDAALSRVLKPHQIEGVRFMWARALHPTQPRGCLLADQMGLGKTLQLISVLAAYFGEGKKTNTAIVIAPAFVLPNWVSEIARWLPGDRLVRARCLPTSATRKVRADSLAQWQDEGGTLLVGYEMFRQLVMSCDKSASAAGNAAVVEALCDPGPGLAVLDEAHRLKDPKSQLYRALARIKTPRRVLASGYPIQNRLDEYYALIDFARRGALGAYETFKTYFERPISSYIEAAHEATTSSAFATRLDDHDGAAPLEASDTTKTALQRAYALQEALRDVVLRRGIDEFGSDLPPRRDWLVHCELSATQRTLYDAFDKAEGREDSTLGELASYHTALAIANHPDIVHNALAEEERLFDVGRDDEKFDDDVGTSDGWLAPEIVESRRRAREERRARDDARRDKMRKKLASRVLSSVARAKAAGYDERDDDDRLDIDVFATMGDLSIWAQPVLRPVVDATDDVGSGYVVGQIDGRCGSGKAAVALALLGAIAARGERAILFTQTLGTLDVLERLIDSRNKCEWKTKPVRFRRIDGSTAASRRGEIVDRFNGENRFTTSSSSGSDTTATTVDASAPKRRSFAPRSKKKTAKATNAGDPDPCDVLLVSIKAGGEGINLVGASRVLLFDVSWNPCFDQQALCRAHRFGQKRPVHVYRLLGPKGTMEARVLRQQRRKELLVREVADVGTPREAAGRQSLALVFDRLDGSTSHSNDVQDDVLREVVSNLGDQWIATVHECVADDDRPSRELLAETEKIGALDDYRTVFCRGPTGNNIDDDHHHHDRVATEA
ncbi:hypothetical protein CTAYLR_004783 [Chrysophaeum taylorii]|uniref:Uncharacterized protein n=1 Tax=Chrysophaeum taylorii TaxID=2483200 RepID=A0AAD7UQ34_9STRA|nr:hypothetical protein CTAYLR_004783 [Chrysophaeum taylorii]